MNTRTHVVDPSVTVIMETVGGNHDKITKAIKSVIAQSYKKTKLLIINYHPMRLQVCGVVPPGIEIINAEDVFCRRVDQHISNLKYVDTDCFTICDDDDWLDKDHVADMVSFWNTCSNRSDKPLQVCGSNYVLHYEDRTEKHSFQGWAVSLFERIAPREVDLVYKNFPVDLVNGSDTWLAGNTYFDRRMFEGNHTYHWDRIGNSHLSMHETNRGKTKSDIFKQCLRHWEVKIAARSKVLEPIVL